ncbi:MAG TPA: FecR domain-containing protein [Polyangia bacterium]|nr:FecR domain-containing protein [Polyangia bacterium]
MSDRREQELDRLCGVLARVDDRHSDLGRSRAEARLRKALRTAVSRRPISALTGASTLAVALATIVIIVRPSPIPDAVAPATALALRPYVVAPTTGGIASFVQGIADGASLDVPDGWLVRASVNDGITVGAVGPARVSVTGTAREPELRVDRGRWLVEVTPNRGIHLRISTPTFAVAVIGTLFSVDASEVAVRHGRVRVSAPGGTTEIDGGFRWRASASTTLEPLDDESAAALDAHAAASSPSAGAVTVAIVGEPAGAEIWQDARRLAVTPASLRLAAGTRLALTAPGRARATIVVPATRTTIAYSLAADDAADVTRLRASRQRPTPSTTPASRPAAAPTPRDLYRDADRALAAGDRDGARAALRSVLSVGGDDTLMDAARLDLANLALESGDRAAARRYLDEVRGDAVAEPAARLRCRVAVASFDRNAADCFAAFRARFPASPHAAEAMAEEAVTRADQNDCARALPLLDNAASLSLPADLRDAVHARLSRCRSSRTSDGQ